MSDYVENEDHFDEILHDTLSSEKKSEETEESEEQVSEEDLDEKDFNPSNIDLEENQIDDDIVTAVLLVQNKSGAVLPVTNLQSLKMERQANAHEVLRMCADVRDQISAIRVVGELAQIFQHLNQTSLKSIAELLSIKMNSSVMPSEED